MCEKDNFGQEKAEQKEAKEGASVEKEEIREEMSPGFEWIKKEKESVTPFDIYKLARNILVGLALIFIISIFVYVKHPEVGGIIFDACKTILPSIATLVIGYYFGERDR